jgi:hypothetical protein
LRFGQANRVAGSVPQGEEKALYDQQPVEAATMADVALAALALLGDENYQAVLQRAQGWFDGANGMSQSLVDAPRVPATTVCKQPE